MKTTPAIYEFARRCASRIRIRPSYVDQDDCIHDCVVAYLELDPQYPPDCPVSRDVWLWRQIVTQVKRKYGRVRQNLPVDDLPLVAEPHDPDAVLDLQAAKDAVGLTEAETVVMGLRYDEGMNQTQIAEHLGVSRPYISEVLKRAHERIKGYYEESDLRADSVVDLRLPRETKPKPRRRGRPVGWRKKVGINSDAGCAVA